MAAWTTSGVTIERYNGSTWDSFGEVVSLSGLNLTRPALDSTNLGSAARTFLRGKLDAGEIQGSGHWDPLDPFIVALRADILAGSQTPVNYRLTLADDSGPTVATVPGILTQFGPVGVGGVDGITEFSFTIKASGTPTITLAT